MNVYAKLTIIDEKIVNNKVLCRCECGSLKWINIYAMKNGGIKSCGCLKKEIMKIEAKKRFTGRTSVNYKNYSGKKIGFITVLKRIENIEEETVYLVQCDCGTQFNVRFSSLRRSKYKHCKCGFPNHKLKKTLEKMKGRCENNVSLDFKWYGQKGVRVCDEWEKFPIRFIEWSLKNGWEDGLAIDRIDSSKGYNPENCQWISRKQNSEKSAKERWELKVLV